MVNTSPILEIQGLKASINDTPVIKDLNLKVKNVIGDLDNLAWKLENQIDITGHENEVKTVTSQIDKIISDSKKLQNDLKKTTKALMK